MYIYYSNIEKRNNTEVSAEKVGSKILKCNSGIAYNIITPLPTNSTTSPSVCSHEHLHPSESYCDHSHTSPHLHNSECGHKLVPHDDHFDFLVKHDDHFHLHHPFQNGCNDHGHFSAFDIEKSNHL